MMKYVNEELSMAAVTEWSTNRRKAIVGAKFREVRCIYGFLSPWEENRRVSRNAT